MSVVESRLLLGCRLNCIFGIVGLVFLWILFGCGWYAGHALEVGQLFCRIVAYHVSYPYGKHLFVVVPILETFGSKGD